VSEASVYAAAFRARAGRRLVARRAYRSVAAGWPEL